MVGIDEAGRGAWAGPLVVAGCSFQGADSAEFVSELRDSKVLSKKKRAYLYELITNSCKTHVAIVPPAKVDADGLTACLCRAMLEIASGLASNGEDIMIDGPYNFLKGTKFEGHTKTLIKADSLIEEVMAASIVAKVTRDRLMAEYDKVYPGYGFGDHVGYGTARHMTALQQLGVCDIHRRSYKPVAKLIEKHF